MDDLSPLDEAGKILEPGGWEPIEADVSGGSVDLELVIQRRERRRGRKKAREVVLAFLQGARTRQDGHARAEYLKELELLAGGEDEPL